MVKIWDADVEIGEERARCLIARQFPGLAPAQIELLGIGWDNAAFLVNGNLVFRFPRRQIGAGLIERECRILPMLAPHLPLPVPIPTFVGQPEADYPYPFAGYELIPGTTACRLAWSEEERRHAAAPLAAFLAALHRIPVPDAVRLWAPGDEIERTNLPKRARTAQERLRKIAPTLQGFRSQSPA
jgi:aminoglycoside phosphotransferase (APT) family kinase protein